MAEGDVMGAFSKAQAAVDGRKHEFEKNIQAIAMELAPYKVGDRIAQMVFLQYPTVELVETEELSSTERQDKGFGSSGN